MPRTNLSLERFHTKPSTYRRGEARKPGPSICSVNPGRSRATGTLDLGHDVVVVQETFLLRDALATGHVTAKATRMLLSFYACQETGTGGGRPLGGLATLCKQAQPSQRMEQGTHWDLGRCTHHLLPFDQGLRIFNVYGYSSDNERALELNRDSGVVHGAVWSGGCFGKSKDLHPWRLELCSG
eukprot:3170295-Amphidinium_carterae.2